MAEDGLHDGYLDGLEGYASSVWDKVQNKSDKSLMLGLAQAGGMRRLPKYVPPNPPLPNEQYRVILSDPPWAGVGAESHYKTVTIPQMARWDVNALNHPEGTVHFMWVVSCLMEPSMDLLRAWGYEYKTVAFIWEKMKNGREFTGRPKPYTQSGVEMVLLARTPHKKPDIADRHVMQIIRAEVGDHSVKPAEIHDRIVRLLTDNQPRLEMFARRTPANAGWDVWGNQANSQASEPLTSSLAALPHKKGQPYLVPLSSKPPRIRRSIYSDIVREFVDSGWHYAKIVGVKATAIISTKRTIQRLGINDVVAYTVNGVVILERLVSIPAKRGLRVDEEYKAALKFIAPKRRPIVVPKEEETEAAALDTSEVVVVSAERPSPDAVPIGLEDTLPDDEVWQELSDDDDLSEFFPQLAHAMRQTSSKELRKVIKEAIALGCKVDKGGSGHLKFYLPNGKMVSYSSTTNRGGAEDELRRKLRAAGLNMRVNTSHTKPKR